MSELVKLKNLFICVTLFAVSLFCGGADIQFSKIKVEPEFVSNTTAQYRNAPSAYSPKVVTANRWLMIKVEYEPPMEKVSLPVISGRGVERRVSVKNYMDDVELKLRVLMDSGVVLGKSKLYAQYTGSTKFWTIRLDGTRHLAVMYLPAMLIDRYCVGKQTVNNSGKAGIRDFYIEASFHHNGELIGRGYYNVSGNDSQAAKKFSRMLALVPKNFILNNSVLSHRNSPWGLYYPDNLDLEKNVRQGE